MSHRGRSAQETQLPRGMLVRYRACLARAEDVPTNPKGGVSRVRDAAQAVQGLAGL